MADLPFEALPVAALLSFIRAMQGPSGLLRHHPYCVVKVQSSLQSVLWVICPDFLLWVQVELP
jgi:hypothetical protein